MKFEIKTKIDITTPEILSIVYTPGVGECCLEIKKDPEKLEELTNFKNSIAVVGDKNQTKQVEEKIFEYVTKYGISAYPLLLKPSKLPASRILESLHPSFYAFDVSLASVEGNFKTTTLQNPPEKLLSENISLSSLDKDVKKASVEMHSALKGVIEAQITDSEQKLIAIISDGSAVLGFGNLGAKPAMPVMEGKAALFKELGGVNAVPICIDTNDSEELIEIIKAISETFDGINLEDICAPKCFEVEKTLIEETNIPIFHDDQHGTAIVVLASVINFLRLSKKDKDTVKIAMSGAGAAAQSVANLLLEYGIKNIILSDINGSVYEGRETNDKYLEKISQKTNSDKIKGSLADIIKGADVFIGLSAANILTEEMVKSMAKNPAVFALANPTPEIMPECAKHAGALVVATGRSDFNNQINNSLAFPGVFKGVLESKIKIINSKIKIKAAEAIARLIKDDELSVDYILPKALDRTVVKAVADSIKA